MNPVLTIPVEHAQDIVIARQRARQIAELLGFDSHSQVRIGTAVSEIVRNAFLYAAGGRVEFLVDSEAMHVRVADSGPGIGQLEAILEGRYRSNSGGGIAAARRLVDQVHFETGSGGTTVLLTKNLPPGTAPVQFESVTLGIQRIAREPQDLVSEIRSQNQELIKTLDELRQSHAALEDQRDELSRLNRELEETNRGVVALYAELDERAERLRDSAASKSRFLSYMSHEFRTPLNGILGLSHLLLSRVSVRGDEEASKQVRYIQSAAEELTGMVNDLLDLAKADAGKLTVHCSQFTVAALFGTLKVMLRPLQVGDPVALIFEPPDDVPPLDTDQTKLTQILGNLVSNALKFTERGEVRVSASHDRDTDRLSFSVADTGIGIPPGMHDFIFEEFAQIEPGARNRKRGTGLGLPLSRRLTTLLGGTLNMQSAPGSGSVFTVAIPRVYARQAADRTVLIIDTQDISRYLLRKLLPEACHVLEASTRNEGLALAREHRPDLVLLDLSMSGGAGAEVLQVLRADPDTREIPVFALTSQSEPGAPVPGPAAGVLSRDQLVRAEGLQIDFGPPVAVSVQARREVGA